MPRGVPRGGPSKSSKAGPPSGDAAKLSLMEAIRKKGKTGLGLKPVDTSKSKKKDQTSTGNSVGSKSSLLAAIQQTKANLGNKTGVGGTEVARKATEGGNAPTPQRRGSRRGSIKKQFVTTPDIVAKRPENNKKSTTTITAAATSTTFRTTPAASVPVPRPGKDAGPRGPPAAPLVKPSVLSASSIAHLGGDGSGAGGPEVRIARNLSTASDWSQPDLDDGDGDVMVFTSPAEKTQEPPHPPRLSPPQLPKSPPQKVETKVAKSVNNKLAQRQKIIDELLATERTYVANLAVLCSTYLAPLEMFTGTRKELLSKQELHQIFGEVRTLVGLHNTLLPELEQLSKEEHNTGNSLTAASDNPQPRHSRTLTGVSKEVGHTFKKFAPLFAMYGKYVAHFEEAQALLATRAAASRKLQAFLSEKQNSSACGGKVSLSVLCSLSSCLSVPPSLSHMHTQMHNCCSRTHAHRRCNLI